MTQEDKELLLKDLCARLPYGVKCQYTCVIQEGTLVTGKSNWIGELKGIIPQRNGHIGFMIDCDKVDALEGDIKPYLRPMSSMTEEEREDFWWNVLDMDWKEDLGYDELEIVPFPFVENGCGFYLDNYYLRDTFAVIDWLNAHHFDYRGLIEKGLAIEVTEENNPYKLIKL